METKELKFKDLDCLVRREETEYIEAGVSMELGFPVTVTAPLDMTDEEILDFFERK